MSAVDLSRVPAQLFIGGEWVDASGGARFEVTNPATDEVLAAVADATAADGRRATDAANAAQTAFAALTPQQRSRILLDAHALLLERKDELAAIMTAEMGKLRREALAEIEKSAGACDYYADHAGDYLRDQSIPTEATRSYVSYEPLGCVFAVMPWNFPIWQVFRFLAPALMAGNVALLKHATNVPRCADAIAEMLALAGVPEGVFGVLHIDNAMAAKVIADFAKGNDKLIVKAGAYAGKALDANGVKALASVPSKEVLLSQIAGLLKSPVQRMAAVVAALAEKRGAPVAAAEAPAA